MRGHSLPCEAFAYKKVRRLLLVYARETKILAVVPYFNKPLSHCSTLLIRDNCKDFNNIVLQDAYKKAFFGL